MNDRARAFWSRTRVVVWPEAYRLVSLPPALLPEAAALVARAHGRFAALVLERDEVSVTLPEALWADSPLRGRASAAAGPYRALTLDVAVDLDVCGYLAPAAARLAEAGISIVPQCAHRADHLLVRDADLGGALRVIEGLIRSSSQGSDAAP